MATMEVITKAIKMIHEHDFFWFYAEYEANARERSKGHMGAFVELVNSIGDYEITKSLKKLWLARYEWAKKNMWEINKDSLRVYEKIEAETLATLSSLTSLSIAA